jgi:hypothetical protein
MSVSYPSSTHLFLCTQSTSSRTPECFRFHPRNSSPAEWRCTPDRRHLYRMLCGKPPAEWCSSAKFGSHVSLFPVPIFVVNRYTLFLWGPPVEDRTVMRELPVFGHRRQGTAGGDSSQKMGRAWATPETGRVGGYNVMNLDRSELGLREKWGI